MNESKVLDLFSGIGGFSLGLEAAGLFRTVAFCEQDEFCQAVLRKHWPDVPIYDDVRTIDTDGYRGIDLVCGGFPCQPWSAAGNKRGAEDDRDLWPVMASLIEDIRPRWVIGENVRGFINEPLGLQRSLSDLESIGYQTVPFVIPACAVDAPHRRDRVWIVAHANRAGQPASEGCGEDGRDKARHDAGRRGADVADASGARLQRSRHEPRETEDAGAGQPVQLDAQVRGQWRVEPDVGRVAHGVPNRVDRLKALGNAVVPQVVAQIGKAIIAAES